ncbi:low temperature requirement protein LtrA [Catenulispora sp. GAS73]|uniref:low temperature requirement protein A n=1 Tax=Catenulispora sp. GAS73 TaxID=3156269 RepID=UPI0035158422
MTPRERWALLRRRLWQPPRPHGEQPRDRVVGPLELFYDLAVVVLVAQAAHHLAGHLAWGRLGEFTAVFTLVWIAWVNGSLHHELHGHEDARARSTFLLQILLLVTMGAMIPDAGGARGAGFAIASAALFAVLAMLWLLASRGDSPEYRRSSLLFVSATAACAVLVAGSALLPSGARVWSWGLIDVAYLTAFGALAIAALPEEASALTITDALIERFGLITIIVLGETLTNVAGGLSNRPINALTLTVGLVAVVVGFGAWWTYFDFAGHREPRPTSRANLQWLLAHLPLTAAIAAMGTAMVSLIAHAHDSRTPAATAWVLCAGTAVALCATMLVAASLQAWRDDRNFYRTLARLCAAVALACLVLAAARPAPVLLGVALVLLLGVPWVFAVWHRLATDDLAND